MMLDSGVEVVIPDDFDDGLFASKGVVVVEAIDSNQVHYAITVIEKGRLIQELADVDGSRPRRYFQANMVVVHPLPTKFRAGRIVHRSNVRLQ